MNFVDSVAGLVMSSLWSLFPSMQKKNSQMCTMFSIPGFSRPGNDMSISVQETENVSDRKQNMLLMKLLVFGNSRISVRNRIIIPRIKFY